MNNIQTLSTKAKTTLNPTAISRRDQMTQKRLARQKGMLRTICPAIFMIFGTGTQIIRAYDMVHNKTTSYQYFFIFGQG